MLYLQSVCLGGFIMNKDLTVGKPASVLWRYSLPLFGSIIFQQMYNIADSFVAGRWIGTSALAAVGNSYEITLIYIAFAFGCNIGSSVVVARHFGSKRYDRVKTTVTTSLIVSMLIGAVLTLLGFFGAGSLLRLIQTPVEIFADSLLYLQIYLAGFLFLLIYNISTGIFSALGDSKTPFIFLMISSVSNVFVDILFVRNFHMGISGVAWATFLCQGIAALAAFIVIMKRLKKMHCDTPAPLYSTECLVELTRIAVPSILQQGFISLGNIMIQTMINGFGMAAVGGYSAAVKLNNMTITSVTALGNGMSNYAAQNAGARKPKRIEEGLIAGFKLSCVIALLFAGLYWFNGRMFVQLFITDGNQEALQAGVMFLKIVSPFYVVVSMKLIADGILRGVNRMKLFMTATLVDLVVRVAFAALFSQVLGLGLNGIWYSWPVGWIIGTALSLYFYNVIKKQNFGI